MKFQNICRLTVVTAISSLAVLALSGFLFIIPFGLFLPNDKKTIDEMEQKKDWTGMLNLAEVRLQVSEKDAGWLYISGFALRRLSRCSEAIPRFQKAIAEKNQDYEAATIEMGVCQMDTGSLDAAVASFYDAIGKHPENWKHYYNIALTYTKKDDLQNARKYLELLKPRNSVMATQLETQVIQPQEARIEQKRLQAEVEMKARVAKEEEAKAKADAEVAAAEKAKTEAEATAKADAEAAVRAAEAQEAEKARMLAAARIPAKSPEVRLKELKQLYSKGLVSKDIYESKQREILQSN